MLNLIWPWVLALAPLPFLYRWLRKSSETKVQALRAPLLAAAAGDQASIKTTTWYNRLQLFLLTLCWLCVLLAVAQPVYIGEPVTLPANGRDILIAVDISGSMERDDMVIGGRKVNRLEP